MVLGITQHEQILTVMVIKSEHIQWYQCQHFKDKKCINISGVEGGLE